MTGWVHPGIVQPDRHLVADLAVRAYLVVVSAPSFAFRPELAVQALDERVVSRKCLACVTSVQEKHPQRPNLLSVHHQTQSAVGVSLGSRDCARCPVEIGATPVWSQWRGWSSTRHATKSCGAFPAAVSVGTGRRLTRKGAADRPSRSARWRGAPLRGRPFVRPQ